MEKFPEDSDDFLIACLAAREDRREARLREIIKNLKAERLRSESVRRRHLASLRRAERVLLTAARDETTEIARRRAVIAKAKKLLEQP